ncbi:MAG: RluA family pseudouridine synthase [Ruthenibacterium sp.]
MQTVNLLALDAQAGLRIDSFVSQQCPAITRSAVQQMLLRGEVLCNGIVPLKSYQMLAGDAVVLSIPDPRTVPIIPQDIPLSIVYEDEMLLVVNKPKGMVVHPAPGNPDGTLVNALLYHCHGNLSGINGEIRPGIVHRIDKDTSGLLVVAKSNEAHLALSEQFAVHSITRVYRAVVYGRVKADSGFVEEPIGRHPIDRKRMAITDKNSKYAYTAYEVVEQYRGFTQLALQLKTGRTHQIRVHMASIGHPLAGDVVYGPKKVLTKLNGQCLHAKTLGFVHPGTGEYMEFDSELPAYFTDFINTLQKD